MEVVMEIIFQYFQCATIPSLTMRVYLRSFSRCFSQKCEVAQNSEKMWTYSSSRSSKVTDLGANRKRICDFLLVRHSNCGHNYLAPFLRYGELLANIAYFSHSSLIRRPCSLCSLWNFEVKLTARKLESWSHSVVKVAWPNFNRFWLIHPCDYYAL